MKVRWKNEIPGSGYEIWDENLKQWISTSWGTIKKFLSRKTVVHFNPVETNESIL